MRSRIIQNSNTAYANSEFYEKRWDPNWFGIDGFKEMRGEFAKQSIRKYTQGTALRILDLGCGFGWLSLFLSQSGSYTGVDFSPKAISYARFVYKDRGEFLVGDPNDPKLGIKGDLFDVVIASEVIEHVQDHDAFLAQLELLLKPTGLLILTTPNGLLYETFKAKYSDQFQPVERWLTPNNLRGLLHKHNFNILSQQGPLVGYPRYGLRSYTVSLRLQKLLGIVGLSNLYNRWLLRASVYQFVVAVKSETDMAKAL